MCINFPVLKIYLLICALTSEMEKTLFKIKFLKEETKSRTEKIQDNLDNAYEILINEAPTISKEFIKLLKSDKIKPYTKSELFGNFFRIIERGWSDKKLNEALLETKERIDSLESGRPVQLTEFPVN